MKPHRPHYFAPMKHFFCMTVFLLILALSSCENEIPYNIGNQEPLLIMNAMLEAGKGENFVYLDISHTHKTTPVKEGSVQLYINGKLAEEAEVVMRDNNWPYTENPTPKFRLTSLFTPGDVLRLEATAENGKYHASAEVTVPQPLPEIKVDTCLANIKVSGTYNIHRQFNISLKDPAGQTNYYRLSIQYDNTVTGTNLSGRDSTAYIHTEAELINSEDAILTDGRPGSTDSDANDNSDIFGNNITNRYNVFSDKRFSGSSCTLKVYSYLYERYTAYDFQGKATLSSTINVRLLNLTEAGYRYLKALNTLKDEDYDETLMEPVTLPTNVKGGLGIVYAYSVTSTAIKLPDQEIDYNEVPFIYN